MPALQRERGAVPRTRYRDHRAIPTADRVGGRTTRAGASCDEATPGDWVTDDRSTEEPATDARSRDDDRALADAVLGGDRDAFRTLVEREGPSVIAACQRVLGDRAEAEDAAQEAFLLAYRKLGAFRGDGALGGWLMRIAIREARDRAIRRRPTTAIDADHDGWSATLVATGDGEDPQATLETSERAARLRAAIAELPKHHRDAVRLRYLDELSFEEIAARTGRPEPTVRTHLHRGLASLRARLGSEARP